MKSLLFILCNLIAGFLMAQDCRDHLLMQKGVQLEYKEYWPKFNPSQKKTERAVSRMLFDVDQVKDSAGNIWSTIIKRGFGVKNVNDHYERKFVLQCDGNNLLIPFDFYLTDTLYAKDMYPESNNLDKYGYAIAFTPLKDTVSYVIPLALGCFLSLPEGKKEIAQIVMPGYLPFSPCKPRSYMVDAMNIKSISQQGKEMVTTPAGTFACYKFCVDVDRNYYGELEPLKYWLYFNREAGLIKLEDVRHFSRYVELTGIRKQSNEAL